ncbi:hypothetical protein [Neobacillus niacini]
MFILILVMDNYKHYFIVERINYLSFAISRVW